MFGIVVLLCTACTGVFQLCIQFCISLAVGSLTGDALLHLLPMVGRDSLKTQKPEKCAERSCRHINCRAVTAVQSIIWVFHKPLTSATPNFALNMQCKKMQPGSITVAV